MDDIDAAARIVPLEDFYRVWSTEKMLQVSYSDSPCFLGLAYGLNGRIADAEALFRRVGPWSRCYAFHGAVLARAGDHAGAMRVWAEGLKIAPDMVHIYLQRGLFEASQAQFREAQADFSTAHAKSPHYADPLKSWGDLLARTGHPQEALAKYDEALRYAPAWAELKRARAQVA